MNLGLAEADFWELTLAQFDALGDRYREAEEWQDYRTGLICSVLANCNRDPKKQRKPYQPRDFMPSRKPEPLVSESAFLDSLIMMNAALGGTMSET